MGWKADTLASQREATPPADRTRAGVCSPARNQLPVARLSPRRRCLSASGGPEVAGPLPGPPPRCRTPRCGCASRRSLIACGLAGFLAVTSHGRRGLAGAVRQFFSRGYTQDFRMATDVEQVFRGRHRFPRASTTFASAGRRSSRERSMETAIESPSRTSPSASRHVDRRELPRTKWLHGTDGRVLSRRLRSSPTRVTLRWSRRWRWTTIPADGTRERLVAGFHLQYEAVLNAANLDMSQSSLDDTNCSGSGRGDAGRRGIILPPPARELEAHRDAHLGREVRTTLPGVG